jgi:hypothetical protein
VGQTGPRDASHSRSQRAKLVEERHSDFVAALSKAIARCAGGHLAAAAACEEELSTKLRMRFVFSDRSSRDLFWRRMSQYCDRVTLDALSLLLIGTLDDIALMPASAEGYRKTLESGRIVHP